MPNAQQELAQSLVTDAVRNGENIETYVREHTTLLAPVTVERIVKLALASNLHA